MPIIPAVAWIALVYVQGHPGDMFVCNMKGMFGAVEATQTVVLEKDGAELRFYVPRDKLDQIGAMEVTCTKIRG